MNKKKDGWGGPWTKHKLKILRKYLDAYTTLLKKQDFKLHYIDAFAGAGEIQLEQRNPDDKESIDGSAKIALAIKDLPFHKLIFIEEDPESLRKLGELKNEDPKRKDDIEIYEGDANEYLQNLPQNWNQSKSKRGVLFIDPFAAEVEWKTIKAVAKVEYLDVWILFPTHAIARFLSIEGTDIKEWAKEKLRRVYGDDSWEKLYEESTQLQMVFPSIESSQRDKGCDGLLKIYKDKLEKLMGKGFLKDSIPLKNSTKARLFEFIFFTTNNSENAITKAHKIAKYLLEMKNAPDVDN